VDGLLDDSYHFDKRLNLPEGGNFAPGTLYHYESSDACYWAYVVDRNYNDNVYSSVDNNYLALDGWTNGHDFRELIHSDMAEFVIQYPGGTTRTFELDYMNWKQTDYGGQP